jgi:biotin operon repressor
MGGLGKWIKHLDERDSKADFRLTEMEEKLSTIETDLEGIKNSVAFMEGSISGRLFKHQTTAKHKQTAVQGVQEAVQTAVQTGGRAVLNNLSTMERALVYILLNSDLKLSYDDLAAMLGKSRATIRGQINSIKQKSEGVVEEVIEANGKKRVFVPESVKEIMLKSGRVRIKGKGRRD